MTVLIRLLLSVMLISVGVSVSTVAADVRDSVVKIYNTQRLPNFSQPWTRANPKELSGTGAIISGNRILTNAHVVLYSSRLMVQAHQSSARVRAKVTAIAPDMDLALIEVSNPSFFENRPPLEFAETLPKVRETVNAYGYPIGGEQISVTEGIVSRIEYASYRYGTRGLRVQVDAALNSGNSGGPAFVNGKIVGIVFSRISNADNIGYLIPNEEVQLFLKDVEDGKYDGKPFLADDTQTVENPALREYLKLPDGVGGMMIKDPFSGKPDYPLKPYDVITAVDGKPIDAQGRIRVQEDLQLSYQYQVPYAAKGDRVPVTIWRKGKSLDVEVPVVRQLPMVIPYLRGRYPRHFILGPMVFTEATQDLLEALGMRGLTILNARRSPLVRRQFARPAFPGEELVILGPRLFTHPITEGYDPQSFGVVTSVNGTKIRNLAHLVETVRDADGEYLIFNLAGNYERLVFRRQEVIDATEEILDDEGIRYQSSEELQKIWDNRQ